MNETKKINHESQEILELLIEVKTSLEDDVQLTYEFYEFFFYLLRTILQIKKDPPLMREVLNVLNRIIQLEDDEKVKENLIQLQNKFVSIQKQMKNSSGKMQKKNNKNLSIYASQNVALFENQEFKPLFV